MTVPNQRDPDLVQIVERNTDDLAALKANVIARWGRVPYLTTDPTAPPDGSVWVRSDGGIRFRSNGVTGALGSLAVHSLATAFGTSAVHTTMQDEGLTVTVPDVAGRRYRWTLALNLYTPGGANGILIQLLRAAAIIRVWSLPVETLSTAASHAVTLTHTEQVAATATSVYKVQIAASTGNTQVTSHGAATVLRQLIVEDIGI